MRTKEFPYFGNYEETRLRGSLWFPYVEKTHACFHVVSHWFPHRNLNLVVSIWFPLHGNDMLVSSCFHERKPQYLDLTISISKHLN